MSEKDIQSAIMKAVSQCGAVIFRNNQGTGVTGQIVGKQGSNFVVANARVTKFGVCNPGGSDLIGWRSVKITPEMVGQTVAIFLALEVKTPSGKPMIEQANFIHAVRTAGGLAGVVRSVDEAVGICNPLNL